jgi:hypothetical protein
MVMKQALLSLDDELQQRKLNPFDFHAAAWEGARCKGRQMGIPFALTADSVHDLDDAHRRSRDLRRDLRQCIRQGGSDARGEQAETNVRHALELFGLALKADRS